MFDPQKTLNLVKDGLLEPGKTWQSYLEENHDCKETAVILTGPLILVSVILSSTLGWVFSSQYMFAHRGGFWATIIGLIATVIGIVIAAFVFSYLAGVFKGKHDFNKGFAALSLAAIPGYLGGVLGTLPMIGWIIAIALGITSMVFLYKIIPVYLEVPEDKRVVHYIVSLVSTFILVFIVNMILGVGAYSTGALNQNHMGNSSSGTQGQVSTGMFGDIERQANMADQAGKDRYEAPKNGEVTEDQMATLIMNMQKVSEYRKRQEEQMKKLDEDMKDKKDFSFSDMAKLTSGIGAVMATANAEMEVVKSGGGNWAEHQWVKDQLRIATIQKDINDAVKHNYALYQKYQDQLKQYGVMY
ncbi:MAG: YIP1 family protein [Gammaproteobacteria bacterium]|nr:YIP1 family protein [Gammaproteobacteria bacterium]